MHYQVYTGLLGYMPNTTDDCENLVDAKETMKSFIESVRDSCEINHDCLAYQIDDFAEFNENHSIEYIDVVPCYEDCEMM